MILNKIILISFLILASCSQIDLVLQENKNPNQLRGKTEVVLGVENNEVFGQELFSLIGKADSANYILTTSLKETKENRLVKNNQVAEKIDYKLSVEYKLYSKKNNCEIFNKILVTKFSFVPKSFGYNFGSDRSFEELYKNNVRNNIQNFIDLVPIGKTVNCI